MKRPFQKFLTKALAFMLLASSPVNVLSTMAYANTVNSTVDSTEVVIPTSPAESPNETVEPIVNPSDGVPTDTSTTDPSVPSPTLPEEPPTSTVPDVPTTTPVDTATPTTPTNPSTPPQPTPTDTFDASKLMSSATTYPEKRQLVDDAIELFKKEQTLEKLKKAIDLYIYLPVIRDSEYVVDKSIYADTLMLLINFLEPSEQQTAKDYFATKMVEMLESSMESTDAGIAIKAINQLLITDSPLDKELTERVNTVMTEIMKDAEKDGYVDWNNGEIVYKDDPTPTTDNYDPDYNPDDFNDPVITPPPFEEGTWDIDNQTGSDIPSTEGMNKDWDYIFNGQVNGDYFNGSGAGGSNGSLTNEQQPTEEMTIHYTLDKTAKNPYYYDTKAVVNADDTIDYQNAKDVLYQIAIQSKGKFVEDTNQSLALIDGRIIVVKDTGKPLPLKEFMALFNETKVGIVAMKGFGGGETMSANELIQEGGVLSLWVNDKEVSLPDQPVLENKTVLYPIKEVAEALGGKVKVETERTIIQYRHNTLTFQDGKLYVVKNDKQVSLEVSTRTSQKGVRMAPIEPLLDVFDATLSVKDHSVTLSTK